MKSESKAFWVFLAWVLLLPFLDQISLKAANVKAVASNSQEVIPMQDFEVSDNAEKDSESDQETELDEDISDIADEEQLPALSADPIDLLGKVNGLAKAKKYANVIKQLSSHEDVIVTDGELLNIYVEALINAKKPNWRTISRFAKLLGKKKRKSSLADYAQGLYYLNKKKPDLTKALKYIGNAKNAKKPFPDAAMQYYIVVLKKYWQILLLIIVVPILIVGKVLKKKKATAKTDTEINIDISSDASGDSKVEVSNEEGCNILEKVDKTTKPLANEPLINSNQSKVDDQKKNDDLSKINIRKADPIITEKDAAPSNLNVNLAPEIDTKKSASFVSSNVQAAVANTKHVAPLVPPIETSVSIPNSAPIPASTPTTAFVSSAQAQPVESYIEDASNNNAAVPQPIQSNDIQQGQTQSNSNSLNTIQNQPFAQKLTETVRQDPVPDTSELDATWNRLCQKAVQKRIPHDFSKNRKTSNDYASSKLTSFASPSNITSQPEPEIDLNVTIDLSEEALREDLIGKLKMLAISDSELRSLFSQKKPAHIPHLIEYVLTRPEPLRLSFVARELGYYVDPAIIDTLASLLYHEDNRVVLGAIQGLENTKSSGAILHICPFLKSETPVLAQAARNALSNFGAVKILKAFLDLPGHSDNKIKEAGIFVLSRMKGKQVESLLVSMLDDEDIEIRKTVLLAMSYQKNPVYIEPLRNFFRIAKDEDKTLSRKAIVYLQGFVTTKSSKDNHD